ncbi:MAG: DUF5040 domain-containing protein [Alistipes sp.]|nr:DUF5040 domain-containing protein [Alistipes sp.]
MRKICLILALLIFVGCTNSCFTPPKRDLCIAGASFAYPENGWLEIACQQIGCSGINKAVSGSNIIDVAMLMSESKFFAPGEMERFDTFVIMHTHNFDVCRNVTEGYEINKNMSRSNAFDYVIRHYIELCRSLEFEPTSRWYGIEGGKRVDIILCTHWHDARTKYNQSVRRLAERWKGYVTLCEFDANIGFTMDDYDPVTGQHISMLYAHEDANKSEKIDGKIYGWHPKRGRESEIQHRMADIFVECYNRSAISANDSL